MFAWIKGYISWLIIGILTVLCLFLIYAWIDARVTIDHAWRVVDWERNDKEVLRTLFQETGKHMSRTELKQLVIKHFGKDHLIKEDARDELSVDNIILKFDGETLTEVRFPDEELITKPRN